MRSNEPIEISDDDSDENEDQLDRENDSFGKFIFFSSEFLLQPETESSFFNRSSCSWLFSSSLLKSSKIIRFLKISLKMISSVIPTMMRICTLIVTFHNAARPS